MPENSVDNILLSDVKFYSNGDIRDLHGMLLSSETCQQLYLENGFIYVRRLLSAVDAGQLWDTAHDIPVMCDNRVMSIQLFLPFIWLKTWVPSNLGVSYAKILWAGGFTIIYFD